MQQVTERVASRHFKKQLASKFSRNDGSIMPSHPMRNIVRQIQCHGLS
jgi:hypothetical protein